ncbi:MAG: hypothetical protein ACI8UD_004135 [Planctomycetota bacterium]|jgi:hypothetical protein
MLSYSGDQIPDDYCGPVLPPVWLYSGSGGVAGGVAGGTIGPGGML